jgi:AcrR family transcriptional regulator
MEDQDIKNKILRGAEELFMKFGVRSVSMDDVARHLSVSKKTIYQYFADKDELITSVSKSHMERDKVEFEKIHADAANAIDELVKISEAMARDFKNMNPALLYDLQKFHPNAWNVWLDYKNDYIRQSVVRNLKQGISEGYFRPEVNTEVLAILRINTVELGFSDQLFPPDRFDLVDVQMQVFEHFILGLLTDKGRKLYDRYKTKESRTQETSIL